LATHDDEGRQTEGEGTFAGVSGNDEVAPIPAVRNKLEIVERTLKMSFKFSSATAHADPNATFTGCFLAAERVRSRHKRPQQETSERHYRSRSVHCVPVLGADLKLQTS